MKNKLIVISLLTVLVFTSCGKEKEIEPVVSEPVETEVVEEANTIEEIQPTEEVEPTEPVEEEPVAEDVPLTQEEIDAYNANSDFKYNAEDNTVTCPDGDVLEAVGQPGDSWKRMDESTAKGILAKGDPTGKLEDYTSMEEYYKARDEYMAADAEVNGWEGSDLGGKWYYDYYQWKAKSDELDGKVIDFERSQLENYDEEFWCD